MTTTPPTQDPNIGRIVAEKYRIDGVIGTGGSGTVYRATHMVLERPIALKVLNPNLVANPNAKARFRREARAASRLDHVNSVQVFDYGIEPDGLTYLAMELLDGRELYKVIYDDWPLSTERMVKIVSQVLSVLAAAHDVGIVHRDLKPENIMLVKRAGDDGRPTEMVKVTDFGIAKTFTGPVTEESLNLTRDGAVHGTPEYMSPEQARGEEVDGRTDLYACGVILYEMMVGALPFTGDGAFDVILKQLTDPVPLPSSKRASVDRRLEPIVLRALAKDRAQRYADAREMRTALLGAVAPASGAASEGGDRPTIESRDREAAPIPMVEKPPHVEEALLLTHKRPLPIGHAASNPTPRREADRTQPIAPAPEPPPIPALAPTLDEPAPKLPGHSPLRNVLTVVIALALLAGVVASALWFLFKPPVHAPEGEHIDAGAGTTSTGDAQTLDGHFAEAGRSTTRPDAGMHAPSNAHAAAPDAVATPTRHAAPAPTRRPAPAVRRAPARTQPRRHAP